MEEKPNYYAIIPANVRYDVDLRASAKLMYGEITALSSKYGVCTASNNYFARLYEVDSSAISKWITQLKNKKYIEVEYETKGKEIKKRIIRIIGTDKCQYVLPNDNGGYCQKDKENNTSINNTSKKEYKERYFDKVELNEIFIEFLQLRKKLKAVNSDRAINSLLKKLNNYDDDTKYKMIEQSIVSSWKNVYEIKENKRKEMEYDTI